MDAYSFRAKLSEGVAHEATLDRLFSRWYQIQRLDPDAPGLPASQRAICRAFQRRGIDRVFLSRGPDRTGYRTRSTVEYKADSTAAATGNAFVETVSVDTDDKPGWASYSCAQFLVYYVPPTGEVTVVPMPSLRAELAGWTATYPIRKVKNRGYHTHGILVPLDNLRALAVASLEA